MKNEQKTNRKQLRNCFVRFFFRHEKLNTSLPHAICCYLPFLSVRYTRIIQGRARAGRVRRGPKYKHLIDFAALFNRFWRIWIFHMQTKNNKQNLSKLVGKSIDSLVWATYSGHERTTG